MNSPYATQTGQAAVTNEPYYNATSDVGMVWDPTAQSGTISVSDQASATAFTTSTYIIATNYNNTGQDKILGSFKWGYNNSGLSSITGNQIVFSPGNCISATAQYILSNDYPNYKLYGN